MLGEKLLVVQVSGVSSCFCVFEFMCGGGCGCVV